MIRLQDITKTYDPHASGAVLQHASLEIRQGEFVAILGRSGSGKTTLLNIIGGLDRTYSGQAVVDGRSLKSMGDRELSHFRNRAIGFVFQTFNLLPHLSCLENVAFPAYFGRAIRQSDIARRAREAMERVEIGHKTASPPGQLSGGERQRVAIARAIFQQPKILLADEPTGNLDTASGMHVMNLFLELNRKDGMTVMLVTHDQTLAAMADRIVRIVDGRISGQERTA